MDFLFLFSRFCHFYHMAPAAVLAMPTRLFFAMERQVGRIRAEGDLRQMAVTAVAMAGGDSATQVRQALVLEQGEVYQIDHSAIVEPESGAADKLKNLV